MQLSKTRLFVTRLLSLNKDHLKLLADLFTAGLLDARSWGGLRKGGTRKSTPGTTSTTASGQTTPAQPLTSTGYNDLFHQLAISSPFPTGASTDATTPGDCAKRSAKLSRDCLKRQNNSCPLTTRTENSLETAHLIPHSVAAMSRQNTAFWLLLAIILDPMLRDHLFSIVHDVKSYSTMNGLALDASMHRYFDAGIFVLLPVTNMAFDPSSTDHLDVTFRWRSSSPNLKTCCTMLPSDPSAQVLKTAEGKSFQSLAPQLRQIEDGDVFRLFTDDAKHLPLPHPFLLSLHALLWRMIGSSGLAETTGNKRKRLAAARPHQNPDTRGGDDGDEDDDDGADHGKRVKRGRGGHQGSSTTRKAVKGKEDGVKSTSRDDGKGSSSSNPQSTTSHHHPQTAVEMPFLEKEYLEFHLRRLAAAVSYTPDGDSDETDDDTSEEENDWASTQYGSPKVSQQPTFLESEFARAHKHRCAPTVGEFHVSGSESEVESDNYYDSDADSRSEAEGQRAGEQGGVEDCEV